MTLCSYGRGYDPSSIVGDRGLAGKIELQFTQSVDGPAANFLETYQFYTFVDGGIVENINVDGLGNSATLDLWSAGAGVRLGLVNNIDVDFAVAYRGNASNSVQNLGNNRLRALFKLEATF